MRKEAEINLQGNDYESLFPGIQTLVFPSGMPSEEQLEDLITCPNFQKTFRKLGKNGIKSEDAYKFTECLGCFQVKMNLRPWSKELLIVGTCDGENSLV